MEHEQILVNGSVDRTTYEGFGEVRQAVPAAHFKLPMAHHRQPLGVLQALGPPL